MRFLKEIVAILVIIVFIITIEIYTANLTRKSVEKIEHKIDDVLENA